MNKESKEVVRFGLEQIPDEGLQRVIDYKGNVLLTGDLDCDASGTF